MVDALLLFLALACNVTGLAWLALAMNVHWRQVRGNRSLPPRAVALLRTLGAVMLTVSLGLCVQVDHLSMAVLVWVMALAAAALIVAFTLSWRPRLLVPLAMWVRAG
jgi:NaMN:DMB phosphoribosyltransferase